MLISSSELAFGIFTLDCEDIAREDTLNISTLKNMMARLDLPAQFLTHETEIHLWGKSRVREKQLIEDVSADEF